jgi:cell filamentation protein
VPADPYTDPVTGVLRNKLGLTTEDELLTAERDITRAALILLKEAPVTPTYNLEHLCEIHRRIFEAVYDWAGQIRTIRISKGSSTFCLPQFIESSSDIIFSELRDEMIARPAPRDKFVERLADYFGEVNALHPFREGNGRAQRAFFEQLAGAAGFVLDWQSLNAARNVDASAAIMHGDPAPMREIFDDLIRWRD